MKTRAWAVLSLIAVGGAGLFLLSGTDAESDRVANQLWISKLPSSDREFIDHLVLIDHDRGRVGVEGRSSSWRHQLEIFKWAREKDQLLYFYPQTRTKQKRTVRTWKCEGEAPRPFELCLEISGGSGDKQLFYSREDWVVEPGDEADSLRAIALEEPALAGRVDPASVQVQEDEE